MYIILGLGIQGEAILDFLLENTDDKIIVVDTKKRPDFMDNKDFTEGRTKYVKEDGMSAIEKFGGKGDIVISCLPTQYNYDLTRACISLGLSMVDLGGVTSVVRKQFELHEKAISHGVAIVPDCGLAPGIISTMASSYANEGYWSSIEAFCGGLPMFPEPPLSYARTFSPEGVIKEYSGLAQEIKNYDVVSYPALSGREFVFVPGFGVLEAERTSGGVSTAVDRLSIRNFSYKTLRYPGHWDYIKKHIMPQKDPIAVLDGMLDNIDESDPDVIILMFRLADNEGTVITKEFFWEYNPELGPNGLSAMAQATGFVVGAVAMTINDTPTKAGVLSMCGFSADDIIEKCRWMGEDQFSEEPISFSTEEEDV